MKEILDENFDELIKKNLEEESEGDTLYERVEIKYSPFEKIALIIFSSALMIGGGFIIQLSDGILYPIMIFGIVLVLYGIWTFLMVISKRIIMNERGGFEYFSFFFKKRRKAKDIIGYSEGIYPTNKKKWLFIISKSSKPISINLKDWWRNSQYLEKAIKNRYEQLEDELAKDAAKKIINKITIVCIVFVLTFLGSILMIPLSL